MNFDVAATDQRRFDAYGPAAFPDDRDVELRKFVAELMSGGSKVVLTASEAASEHGRQVMRAFAERAASIAVRERDRSLLLNALVAIVVGGLGNNEKEALMVMPLIEDAAGRLGEDLPALFEQAAETVGHQGTLRLVMWLSRKPEDRTLSCMRYEAYEGPDGFRYRWSERYVLRLLGATTGASFDSLVEKATTAIARTERWTQSFEVRMGAGPNVTIEQRATSPNFHVTVRWGSQIGEAATTSIARCIEIADRMSFSFYEMRRDFGEELR